MTLSRRCPRATGPADQTPDPSDLDRAVAGEYGCERLAHHGLNTIPIERLRRVLAGRAAAKVLIYEKQRRAFVFGFVEWMRLELAGGIEAFVEKRVIPHTREGNFFQIPRGNYPIRVDIIAGDWHRGSLDASDFDDFAHDFS